MVKLKEVRGLGSERVELPNGQVIEYDPEAELEEIGRGIRSKCAQGSCREQRVSGSRYCSTHLAALQSGKGRR